MANPLRGEVDLVVGSAAYILRLSINQVVELETLLDMGVVEISVALSDVTSPRLGLWRAALWAALHEHQPSLTLLDAGDLIAAAGFPTIMGKVGEAMQAAFPSAEGAAENPPKAGPAGTG